MCEFRKLATIGWLVLILTILACGFGCADKSTGSGSDDDDDNDTTDDDAPASGVGSYSVHLNLAPVAIGDGPEIAARTVYTPAGEELTAQTILVSDVLASLDAFTADAGNFTYRFINFFDLESAAAVAFADLANVAFYEDPDKTVLCLGWLVPGHEADSLCDMENGYLVTIPVDGAYELQDLAYVNERSGEQPTHLGETVALRAVAHTGANTIVSGSYLKTYLQQDGYGVKVFADPAATVADQGYDGTLYAEAETFPGDEIFVLGHITLHNGMIELVPLSAYHLAVLSINNPVPDPVTLTIGELKDDRYRYCGVLTRLDDVRIVDVNPDDPTTDWPDFGTKSKDIVIQHSTGGDKIGLPVYEHTGLPGSEKPADGFDVIGVPEVDGEATQLFPRRVEDINPTDQRLAGTIRVTVNGEDLSALVDLADLPAGQQPIGEDGALVPVVSLAEVAHAAGLTRNPKLLDFKPVAYDGRQPFDTLYYDELKSGTLYQDTPTEEEQPDPMVSSYFWAQMGLSEIYFLRGVTQIQAFRAVEPPTEGEAEYGEGITLKINGHSFAVPFAGMATTEYEGQEVIPAAQLINDLVIGQFTMGGSFTTEQIKLLYDYRLVSKDADDEATVRYADLAGGYVVVDDDPYIFFPDLGDAYRVDQLLVVEMKRYIQVDLGDGSDPTVVYLSDCATESVDVGDGTMEDVVFFKTVLDEAGVDTGTGMYRYEFWLIASDEFASTWDYGHGHLESMYFRPLENRGYTVDPEIAAYGGRVSTKAVYEIELHDVPQEAPSIQVIVDGVTLWGNDANSCDGCHFKEDTLQLPIDCTSCHDVP
ncbi:MAG: hypothetical protein GX444_02010 [Myxococcales bacterium]|nr:hypothetical protein [Myxococcales bacterium]